MNRSCEQIESLLPSYVEGTLDDADAAAVRMHVESCATCRESLVTFTVLEQSLVSRRDQVPPLERFLPDLATAGVPGAAHVSRLMRAFRSMMSLPGVATLLVVWAGLFAFAFREKIGAAIMAATPDRLTVFQDHLTSALVTAADGNAWTLLAVSILVSVLIVLSTGAMTLRYIRH